MRKPSLKDLTRARLEFDETVKEMAEKIGCSRTYLYECLKYPNKNPSIHRKIVEYIDASEKLQNQPA